jgi:purine nucleoside phosphorylase
MHSTVVNRNRLRATLNIIIIYYHTHIYIGTYVQSKGPRFETKAEIKYMSSFGDIIGMTWYEYYIYIEFLLSYL